MIKKKPVRDLLGESLAELLKSKPFEKITVNEIAENCGVGRRTFYNNFRDKYDMATWLYMRQLNEFVDTRENARLADFVEYSTEVVSKDLQIIAAIEKYYNRTVSDEMRQDIEFYVGGQIAYVGRVIHNPVIPTAEKATELFIRCIPESLKEFI